MKYKQLNTEFTECGFHFKEELRKKNIAIYSKEKNGIKSYETIIVTRHDGYTIAGNYIEPAEVYPSNTAWGKNGFTYKTFGEAVDKMEQLIEENKNV